MINFYRDILIIDPWTLNLNRAKSIKDDPMIDEENGMGLEAYFTHFLWINTFMRNGKFDAYNMSFLGLKHNIRNDSGYWINRKVGSMVTESGYLGVFYMDEVAKYSLALIQKFKSVENFGLKFTDDSAYPISVADRDDEYIGKAIDILSKKNRVFIMHELSKEAQGNWQKMLSECKYF